MRLRLLLPPVEPTQFILPTACPQNGCDGKVLTLFQEIEKPLRDTKYLQVTVRRYQCRACKHTFRLYPQGVCADQTSQRVKTLAVLLYLLGLSYGLTASALEILGVYFCKSQVWEAVQMAQQAHPQLNTLRIETKTQIMTSGPNLLSISYYTHWLPVNLLMGDLSQLVLNATPLEVGQLDALQSGLAPIAHTMATELLVTP